MTDEPILISTGRSTSKKKYHTRMCRTARKAKNIREVSDEEAETMDLELCTYCAGEHTTDTYDQSFQDALKAEAEKYAAGGD